MPEKRLHPMAAAWITRTRGRWTTTAEGTVTEPFPGRELRETLDSGIVGTFLVYVRILVAVFRVGPPDGRTFRTVANIYAAAPTPRRA